MAQLKNTTIDGTGFVQLPIGTTGQRPSVADGQIRYNSDTGKNEFYDSASGEWNDTATTGVVATGGDAIYDIDTEGGKYRVHIFSSTGTSSFNVLKGGEIEYLIVGGGGGGSGNFYDDGGGGGAGGLVKGSTDITPNTYSVVVGARGTWSSGSGGDSSAFGLTALGGGGGGSHRSPGRDGGSGGGGLGSFAGDNFNVDGGTATQPGSASGGFGNDGGTGGLNNVNPNGGGYPGSGGGGGAGEPGIWPRGSGANQGGRGGDGLLVDITGIPTYYAAGGGGLLGGRGGIGGGANASGGRGTTAAIDAPNNSGSGGGGGRASGDSGSPSNGGSGIVVARYALSPGNPTSVNGKLITDGLVLDIDFADARTYSGYGNQINLRNGRSNLSRGTFVNGVTTEYPASVGGCAVFNSGNNYIQLGDYRDNFISDPTLNGGRISFTLWAYTTGGYYIISSGSQTSSSGVAFSYQNGAPFASIKTSSQAASLDGFTFPLNQWIFWSFTSDGSTFRGYRNGVEFDSESLAGSGSSNAQPNLVIGQPNNALANNLHFLGKLATTKFYNRQLSATEVAQEFEATRWRFGV